MKIKTRLIASVLIVIMAVACKKQAINANQNGTVQSSGVVSTLAGSSSPGFVNGTGTAASFDYPTGVATDASGNIYVADRSNSVIRKVTPAGVVTTFASGFSEGFDSSAVVTVPFNRPYGVAVDAAGNVYVADYGNHSIRKIYPSGTGISLAGSNTIGFVNGTGSAASFNYPTGVAVDAANNVYVADYYNNAIRKITPAGVVTTFAGSGNIGSSDGIGQAASFNKPYGVAVDASGNVYVGDRGNNTIRKITPQGVVSTLAGSGVAGSNDGTGTAATFNNPCQLTIDPSGNIYVADFDNNKIRKVTSSGVVTTYAGSGAIGSQNGPAATATFYSPSGVAIDAYGTVYVADYSNHLIRSIKPSNGEAESKPKEE